MVCKPAAASMPQNAILTCHSPGEKQKAQTQHHTAQRNKKALVEVFFLLSGKDAELPVTFPPGLVGTEVQFRSMGMGEKCAPRAC